MGEFRDIPNTDGKYQVSNFGRVRSNYYHKSKKSCILSNYDTGGGYLSVRIVFNGILKRYRVHRLVAYVFLGLDLMDKSSLVLHLDNNPSNNCVENLKVGTNSENQKQAYRDGKQPYQRGEINGNASLTNKQALEIKNLYNQKKYSQRGLALIFGVSQFVVFRIVNNKSYKL